MRENEAKAAFEEWVALTQRGVELPAGVLGHIQSEVPDGCVWAIGAEARMFWALGSDDVLRELTLTGNQVSSTSRSLRGCLITVSHSTTLVEDYQETETRQMHNWTFSVDGTQLLALTGTVYGERGLPRDRPDRRQLLALALQEIAARSAP